jgi:hypothetical protein
MAARSARRMPWKNRLRSSLCLMAGRAQAGLARQKLPRNAPCGISFQTLAMNPSLTLTFLI